MIPPRLKLVDANLELLTAAVAGGAALEALLGVSVAEDWAGFPEALPVLRASYAEDPNGHVRSRIQACVRSMRTHSGTPIRRRESSRSPDF
jgi:hypothetical protein